MFLEPSTFKLQNLYREQQLKIMNNLTTGITNRTTYAEIIENNIFGGELADKVFKRFLEIYKKHKSASVDEAIMFYVTNEVAKTYVNSFESTIDHKSDININRFWMKEVDYQRVRLFGSLIDYYNLHPDNQKSIIKSYSKTYFSRVIKSPNNHGLCVANLSEIFNWQEQAPNTKSDSNINTNNSARKRIYNSSLKELKKIDVLLKSRGDNAEISGTLGCALARYELYRHASLHKIDRRNIKTIAELLSQQYCMKLLFCHKMLNK